MATAGAYARTGGTHVGKGFESWSKHFKFFRGFWELQQLEGDQVEEGKGLQVVISNAQRAGSMDSGAATPQRDAR